jgi:hypothetical protein
MRKITFFVIIGLYIFRFPASAQSTSDEKAISAVLERLFKGMELGDSAMVRSTFAKRVAVAGISFDQNNETVLRVDEKAMDTFLKAIGTKHSATWYEEFWDLEIQTDGILAQTWCNYAFYSGKSFSHCGVDAFQLYKSSDGWKIFQLADTRRKGDCGIPEEIRRRRE